MAPSAAYTTTVKRQGTSTAFTAEATTKVTANTVYQITDATKRIVDPSPGFIVEVDADGGGAGGWAVASASTYSIDPLSGIITFTSDQGVDALVRITGYYLPTLTVAEAAEYTITLSCNLLDSTSFDTGGNTTRVGGVFNGSVSLRGLRLPTEDMDPGGGTKKFAEDLKNRTPLLLEIGVAGSSSKFRAWVVAKSSEITGAPDSLVENALEFELAARRMTGRSEDAAWSWAT